MIKTSDLIDLIFNFPPPKKKSLEILPTAFSPGREQFQSPLPDPNRSRREAQSEKRKREKDDDLILNSMIALKEKNHIFLFGLSVGGKKRQIFLFVVERKKKRKKKK